MSADTSAIEAKAELLHMGQIRRSWTRSGLRQQTAVVAPTVMRASREKNALTHAMKEAWHLESIAAGRS